MVHLLEQWLHDKDEAALVILLDRAEVMGLGEPPIEGQPPPWGGERREWARNLCPECAGDGVTCEPADGYGTCMRCEGRGTLGHEHVWLPVSDANGRTVTGPRLWRCTCGMFEHERNGYVQLRPYQRRAIDQARERITRPVQAIGRTRPLIVAETARASDADDITQRYLDGDPHVRR